MLEGAKATTETVDALRTGAAAMKAMQKATCVLESCLCFKFFSDLTLFSFFLYFFFLNFMAWLIISIQLLVLIYDIVELHHFLFQEY